MSRDRCSFALVSLGSATSWHAKCLGTNQSMNVTKGIIIPWNART
jgi:hypothetical protein